MVNEQKEFPVALRVSCFFFLFVYRAQYIISGNKLHNQDDRRAQCTYNGCWRFNGRWVKNLLAHFAYSLFYSNSYAPFVELSFLLFHRLLLVGEESSVFHPAIDDIRPTSSSSNASIFLHSGVLHCWWMLLPVFCYAECSTWAALASISSWCFCYGDSWSTCYTGAHRRCVRCNVCFTGRSATFNVSRVSSSFSSFPIRLSPLLAPFNSSICCCTSVATTFNPVPGIIDHCFLHFFLRLGEYNKKKRMIKYFFFYFRELTMTVFLHSNPICISEHGAIEHCNIYE